MCAARCLGRINKEIDFVRSGNGFGDLDLLPCTGRYRSVCRHAAKRDSICGDCRIIVRRKRIGAGAGYGRTVVIKLGSAGGRSFQYAALACAGFVFHDRPRAGCRRSFRIGDIVGIAVGGRNEIEGSDGFRGIEIVFIKQDTVLVYDLLRKRRVVIGDHNSRQRLPVKSRHVSSAGKVKITGILPSIEAVVAPGRI